jgi:hypothetical protein
MRVHTSLTSQTHADDAPIQLQHSLARCRRRPPAYPAVPSGSRLHLGPRQREAGDQQLQVQQRAAVRCHEVHAAARPFQCCRGLDAAVLSGSVPLLRWLRQLPGVQFGNNDWGALLSHTAFIGHTAMCAFLREQGCAWDTEACDNAAANGTVRRCAGCERLAARGTSTTCASTQPTAAAAECSATCCSRACLQMQRC